MQLCMSPFLYIWGLLFYTGRCVYRSTQGPNWRLPLTLRIPTVEYPRIPNIGYSRTHNARYTRISNIGYLCIPHIEYLNIG